MIVAATYYTDKKYKAAAQVLLKSLEEFNIKAVAYAWPDKGDWRSNVYQKPHVVRKAMNDYPMNDILFCDADSRCVSYPKELDENDWEFACHFMDHGYPVSATVFIRNTQRGRALVDKWAEGCDRGEGFNEDYHWLRLAIESIPHFRVGHLPPAYFWMDGWKARFPTAVPVFEHYTIGEHNFGLESW